MTNGSPSDGSGCWQDQGLLVLEIHGSELPDRCVVCGETTTYRLKKSFSWHPPGYYFLIFLGWLFYLIAALIVRKSVTVPMGLCDLHRAQRTKGLYVLWGALGGGVLLFILGAAFDSTLLLIVAPIGIVVGAIMGGRMVRTMKPTRIDKTRAWFKAGAPFVASLPELSGAED